MVRVSFPCCQHHTGITLPLFTVAPSFSSLGSIAGTCRVRSESSAGHGNMRPHEDFRWAEGCGATRGPYPAPHGLVIQSLCSVGTKVRVYYVPQLLTPAEKSELTFILVMKLNRR